MKKQGILLILTALLLVNSYCIHSQNTNSTVIEDSPQRVALIGEIEKKYEIEEGFVKYKMDIMGMEVEINLYFKEYGQLESTITNAEMMGQKMSNITLQKDGFIYGYSNLSNKGVKSKIVYDGSDLGNKGPQFDVASIKKLGGKELGKEKFLDKNCIVFELEQNDAKSKFWIWKNIMLKMTAIQQGMEMTMEATEFSESPDFPDGIFELPDNIELVDKNEEPSVEVEESE